MSEVNIAELLKKGGTCVDVEGSTPLEIYEKVCKIMPLPQGISSDDVFEGLCGREKIMSTAVGRGIALPHCRTALLRNNQDQQITVCYLKNPIDMNAPDELKVSVMFILLTSNSQTHLKILSKLVQLFKDENFKEMLKRKASAEELATLVK